MNRLGMAVVASIFVATASLGTAGVSTAAVPCEARSAAHVAEHGGIHEDSRWHVLNGELPTCQEQTTVHPVPAQDNDDNEKSRYCSKRWFC